MRILIGRLRRDLMLLGTESDEASADGGESLEETGAKAVQQGRAAEAWIIEASAHYSESHHNWVEVDRGVEHGAQSQGVPLNPPGIDGATGEGPALDDPGATPGESIRGNIEAERRAQIESGTLVNTGKPDTDHANVQGKPNPLPPAEEDPKELVEKPAKK